MTTNPRFSVAASRAVSLSVVGVLSIWSAPVLSQTIDGTLIDSASNQPLPHTYVVLIDSSGREVVRTPTDAAGAFRFYPPRAGQYRIDLAQVGWDAAPSSPFEVGPGDPIAVRYAVARRAVDLSAVGASAVCGTPDGVQPAWDEMRKALGATSWTAAARRNTMRMRLFRRELGMDARVVRSEDDSTATDAPALPFANQDPRLVIDSGFARADAEGRLTYFVPDPGTLLTPEFAATHCFALERDADRLGVVFTPRADRVPGVSGTLWLDASSGELQRLDFRYLNDPSGANDDRVGGVVTFRRLSPVDWVVTNWRLRMPEMTNGDSLRSAEHVGYHEVGGRLLEVTDSTETPLYADRSTAVLTGTVFDGTRNAPLANAVVTLVGTEHWTTTDPSGQFVIAGPLDGTYRLAYGHPRVDSLGYRAPVHMVDLDRQTSVGVDLAVPPFEAIISQRCEGIEWSEQSRMLHGVVRTKNGRPVSGALVQISRAIVPAVLQQLMSDDLNLLAVTDSLGAYALCGIPVGRSIVVNAAIEGESSELVAVEFADSSVQLNQRSIALRRPVARLDLRLAPHADRDTEIGGMVTDASSGEPVGGALVQLDGTGFTSQTDGMGRFRMLGVPTGTVNLSVRRVGYRSVHRQVLVQQARPIALTADSLAMIPVGEHTTELDPITVEAEPYARKLAGFDDRRSMGIGSFVTREEFERWNPTIATDVLRHMRGIRVIPNGSYGMAGDTRRYVIRSSRDIGQRITRVEPINAVRNVGSFNESGNTIITECAMLVFIDGLFVGDSRDTDVDNIISTTNLTAVEVYTASQVPARFRLQGSTCGVVVFWTR